MGKKKTGTQIAKMAMDRARGRVIDNCWRAIFDFKSGEPKRLQKSIDILKHFDRLPAHGSAESILSKAAETAKKHGFNSDVKSSTPGNRATTHRSKPVKSGSRKHKSDAFYASWEWKKVRYEALVMHGRQCMVCGFTPTPGCKERLVVDHIKPRSKFPGLALSLSNLQVLCNSCNMGKSNIHQHDFRAEWHGDEEELEDDPLTAQFRATMQ